MSRLIDASEVIRRIKIETNPDLGGELGLFNRYKLINMIEDIPTVDVVEVRHGENITKNHPVDEFICSECGLIMRDCCRYGIDEDADPPDENCYEFEFRYCPRCGVKIDN